MGLVGFNLVSFNLVSFLRCISVDVSFFACTIALLGFPCVQDLMPKKVKALLDDIILNLLLPINLTFWVNW